VTGFDVRIPIRIRVVGQPTDEDLRRVEDAVARSVAAQLRAAQSFAAGSRPPDPFDPFRTRLMEQAREAARHPPPRVPAPPEPVVAGDEAQQAEVFELRTAALWERPDVQATMERLARAVEASRPGDPKHNRTAMLNYWEDAFRGSIEYILATRTTQTVSVPQKGKAAPKVQQVSARAKGRITLALEEAKLVESSPADRLVADVTALRERRRAEWTDRVERAVQRFLVIAENDAEQYTSGEIGRKPEFVFGLPKGLEPEVTWQQAPNQLEKGAAPVTQSVVTFWKAVQAELSAGHQKDVAENYADHETHNPHFTDLSIGKYSFDVHPSVPVVADTGFYDRAALLDYLGAIERASAKSGIEWVAFYNDMAVVRQFNDAVKKRRLVFSGGGGHGQFHHGPEPYILHLHINVMPKDLAAVFLTGQRLIEAKRIFTSWWSTFIGGP